MVTRTKKAKEGGPVLYKIKATTAENILTYVSART